MAREYDIVIFGATGFTGKLVVEYMQRMYTDSNMKWAIAGRNPDKLAAVNTTGDLNVVNADALDAESMDELAAMTRVVLTTAGPYARYGSELVRACAKYGTHYCDLTGEVHWMREMIDAHQSAAEGSGAIIVPTSGFDSIPSDLGVFLLQDEMLKRHGVPASHIKFRTRRMSGGFSGGTIDSMMAMMERAEENPDILKTIADPYALNFKHRGLDGLDSNGAVYDADFKSWIAPFVMAPINTRVVRRTNELLDLRYGPDFRYEEGMAVGDGPMGAATAYSASAGLTFFNGLPRLRPARGLMQRVLPKPGEGPSREAIERGFFNVELMAKHPTDQDKHLWLKISGQQDPGYGATAKMLAQSAVCLAQDDLEVGGGFWTPASAMGHHLIKRLEDHADMRFELSES